MAQKTIMLVCSAGMSTSMLVQRMKKAAAADGIDVDVFATAAADADNKLASEQFRSSCSARKSGLWKASLKPRLTRKRFQWR